MVENLNQKLQTAESRLTQLEQCECMQSCSVGDKRYRDGETWQKDHCTKCTCRVSQNFYCYHLLSSLLFNQLSIWSSSSLSLLLLLLS